jgi:hypothetical protein
MKHGSFGPSTRLFAAVLVSAAASSGCVPVTPGALGPAGFNQPTYGYHIDYTKPDARSFLGPDWRIDNFVPDETTGTWKPKDGPNYVATRELDEDDDGKIAAGEMHTEPIYDLRLTNVHDDGVIWTKAHPLASQNSGRDLDVELNGYADSLSGTGAYYQGSVFAVEHVKTRQFTTFVVNQEKRSVAGLDGLIATVEVAETARLQLEPTYRNAKIRVFLAKIRYLHRLAVVSVDPDTGKPTLASTRWPRVRCSEEGTTTCEQKVGLLVVGYVNEASHFDQHIPEYETFLSKISPGSATQSQSAGVARARSSPNDQGSP